MQNVETRHAASDSSDFLRNEETIVRRENEVAEKESLHDLESQKHTHAIETGTSQLRVYIYLATYFLINFGLTFYNKSIMGSVSFFKIY